MWTSGYGVQLRLSGLVLLNVYPADLTSQLLARQSLANLAMFIALFVSHIYIFQVHRYCIILIKFCVYSVCISMFFWVSERASQFWFSIPSKTHSLNAFELWLRHWRPFRLCFYLITIFWLAAYDHGEVTYRHKLCMSSLLVERSNQIVIS